MLVCALVFSAVGFAAALPFETQFEYDKAKLGWLTDLTIREDLNNISALVGKGGLTAAPAYPYTETAETFTADVDKYLQVYDLKEDSLTTSYVAIFEMLGANSDAFAAGVSDSAVRSYLENVGITYSSEPDSGMKVLAKALYAAMITGAFEGITEEDLAAGLTLEKALIKYVSSLSGLTQSDVARFSPDGADSLSEYMLASARYTLWSNGYDVDENTPQDRVTALAAVMTIRSLGLSVDENASFDTLRATYTAALLGKKYDVTVAPETLAPAIEGGTVPRYLLQLIGQKNGLSVKSDASLGDAFDLVAKNTDTFSLEANEFYADVYDYTLQLSAARSCVWVYPISYAGTVDGALVNITVNGKAAEDGYYTQIPVDPDLKEQKLVIRVEAVYRGETDVETYTVTLTQGEGAGSQPGKDPGSEAVYESSETIIAQILRNAGVNERIVKAADNLIDGLSEEAKDAMYFIAPTFSGEEEAAESKQPVKTVLPDEFNTEWIRSAGFISILDRLGAVKDSPIAGIDGVTVAEGLKSGEVFSLITVK